MSKIYFSLHDANEMIEKIKPKIEKLIYLSEELEVLDNTKIEFDNEKLENYLLEIDLNKNFHSKSLELYSILEELTKDGCIIRELNDFEIDFYSRMNDKDIVFCWEPWQKKILYWHYPRESKKIRRPINEIEKKYFEKLKNLR